MQQKGNETSGTNNQDNENAGDCSCVLRHMSASKSGGVAVVRVWYCGNVASFSDISHIWKHHGLCKQLCEPITLRRYE